MISSHIWRGFPLSSNFMGGIFIVFLTSTYPIVASCSYGAQLASFKVDI